MQRALNPFHEEIEAAYRGVKAAVEKGMGNIVLETDALLLKLAFEGNDYDLSSVSSTLLCDLKIMIATNFVSFVGEFCPRGCNKVADMLAAHGSCLVEEPDMLMDGCPDFCKRYCGLCAIWLMETLISI